MNDLEIRVMRNLHTKLLDLEPSYIAPFLYEKRVLNDDQLMEIIDSQERVVSAIRAQKFLLLIKKACSMELFLCALRYQCAYPFLAEEIEKELEILEGNEPREKINNEPRRIQPGGPERRKLIRFSHYLKRLHHSGNQEEFDRVAKIMTKFWRKKSLDKSILVSQRQSLADHLFYSLDAKLGNLKIKNETGDTINLEQMTITGIKDILPFTTNPTVCSMNFLARHASVLSDRVSTEEGLTMLDYSKAQSQLVEPCKESGMVLYIEHNILSKKFEKVDYPWIKDRMVQCAKEGIYHFRQEGEEVGNDFEAMLLLKIAFCHLGLSISGKKYTHYTATKSDMKSAKNCLDRIEEVLWKYLDNRRKMFFFVGRAVLAEYDKKRTLAVMYSRQAKEEATEGKFRELPVITELVSEAVGRQQETTQELPLTEAELMKQFQDAGFDSLGSEDSEAEPNRDVLQGLEDPSRGNKNDQFGGYNTSPTLSASEAGNADTKSIDFEVGGVNAIACGIHCPEISDTVKDCKDSESNSTVNIRGGVEDLESNSTMNIQGGAHFLSCDEACTSGITIHKDKFKSRSSNISLSGSGTEHTESSSFLNIVGGVEYESNCGQSYMLNHRPEQKELKSETFDRQPKTVEHFESTSLMNICGGTEVLVNGDSSEFYKCEMEPENAVSNCSSQLPAREGEENSEAESRDGDERNALCDSGDTVRNALPRIVSSVSGFFKSYFE